MGFLWDGGRGEGKASLPEKPWRETGRETGLQSLSDWRQEDCRAGDWRKSAGLPPVSSQSAQSPPVTSSHLPVEPDSVWLQAGGWRTGGRD